VIGGGYIGLELGLVYKNLGCQVEVVEFMDRVLPGMESGALEGDGARSLKKKQAAGAPRAQGASATRRRRTASASRSRRVRASKQSTIECDVILS
jgi:dihydrolipoamide dehydrogenase